MLATLASLAEEPTGASLAFTSNDPAVLKALALAIYVYYHAYVGGYREAGTYKG